MRRVGIVVPCYKVSGQVLDLLDKIGPEAHFIYCVDDACPEKSGDLIEEKCLDGRVQVLRHEKNKGVGGAMVTGYRQALEDGCDVVVKLDGDGQMDPALLPLFIEPILAGEADYTKGNRFYNISDLDQMPTFRLVGNALLSFITKLSSGYWNLFDPTNGYTAVHSALLAELPLERIAKGYFFESDMLFRLGTLKAVVQDVPMKAIYAGEVSNLKVRRVLGSFFWRNFKNFTKRVFYNYFLRDFNIASLMLLIGLPLTLFGVIFGAYSWWAGAQAGVPATTGTVMLAVLPILMGVQLLLTALQYDFQAVPRQPVHPNLRRTFFRRAENLERIEKRVRNGRS